MCWGCSTVVDRNRLHDEASIIASYNCDEHLTGRQPIEEVPHMHNAKAQLTKYCLHNNNHYTTVYYALASINFHTYAWNAIPQASMYNFSTNN